MRIKKPIMKILSIGLMFAVFQSADALTVQVFTDTAHPVFVQGVGQDVTVTYYNLDQLHVLIGKMNRAIRGEEPAMAELQAKQLLRHYNKQLKHAADGMSFIYRYKVKTLPSIVFNHGEYQIVGQTNLIRAIKEYKKWVSEKS